MRRPCHAVYARETMKIGCVRRSRLLNPTQADILWAKRDLTASVPGHAGPWLNGHVLPTNSFVLTLNR